MGSSVSFYIYYRNITKKISRNRSNANQSCIANTMAEDIICPVILVCFRLARGRTIRHDRGIASKIIQIGTRAAKERLQS